MHVKRVPIKIMTQHIVTPHNPPCTKLCINCKHFKQDLTGLQFGKCTLYGTQNLVDGTIQYTYASIARKYECKGTYYEFKPSSSDQCVLPLQTFYKFLMKSIKIL